MSNTTTGTSVPVTFDNSKHFLQSTTLWSIFVAIFAFALQKFAKYIPFLASLDASSVAQTALNALQSTSLFAAAVARFNATQPLTLSKPPAVLKSLLVFVCLAGVSLSSISCSLSTLGLADKTVLSITLSEQTLTAAVQAHEISSAQAAALLPYLESARAAKASMVAAAEAGDTNTYQLAAGALQSSLSTFNTQLAAAKSTTTKPVTK